MKEKTQGKPVMSTEEQFYHAFIDTRKGFRFVLRGPGEIVGYPERVGRYNIRVKRDDGRQVLIYKSAIIFVEPLEK